MHFFGNYLQRVDAKRRPVVPQKFRDQIGDAELRKGLVVTPGFDKCLFLFPMSLWEAVAGELGSAHFSSFETRTLQRLFLSQALEVMPDKVGRISIPDRLRELAGIEDEVLFVGVWNRIELWSPSRWTAVTETHQGQFEELAEKLYGLLREREMRPNPGCQER
jgi:MraZ protein